MLGSGAPTAANTPDAKAVGVIRDDAAGDGDVVIGVRSNISESLKIGVAHAGGRFRAAYVYKPLHPVRVYAGS